MSVEGPSFIASSLVARIGVASAEKHPEPGSADKMIKLKSVEYFSHTPHQVVRSQQTLLDEAQG